MQPKAQIARCESEAPGDSHDFAPGRGGTDQGTESDAASAASPEAVVAIELNFNAFADDVPPTQHAKRIATQHDPSIQDFADQALEVSALRAELRRLNRDYDALQHTVRAREAQVQALRQQLSSARAQAGAAIPQLQERKTECTQSVVANVADDPSPVPSPEMACEGATRSENATPPGNEASVSEDASAEHDASSTVVLRNGPIADHSTTITDMPQMMRDPSALSASPGRKLIPEGHEGRAVLLDRDVITIGRTRQNDICIPSRAVSRDHARLLLAVSGVTLFDMDSANGCCVNGEPVKRHKLRDGDVIRIGDRSYRFADHPNGAQRNRTVVGNRG